MRPVTVTVTYDDPHWVATIPALDDLQVRWRGLPLLEEHVRKAIGKARRVPQAALQELELNFTYDLGDPELEAELAELRGIREWLKGQRLAERSDAAASKLIAAKHSVRDVGFLAGLSIGRINQIAPQGLGDFGLGEREAPVSKVRGPNAVAKAAREAQKTAKKTPAKGAAKATRRRAVAK